MDIYKNTWNTEGSYNYATDGEVFQEGALDYALANFGFMNPNNELVTYQDLKNARIIKYKNYNISQSGFYLSVNSTTYPKKFNMKFTNSNDSNIFTPSIYTGTYLYLIIIPTLYSIILYYYYKTPSSTSENDVKLSEVFSYPNSNFGVCFAPLVQDYNLFNSNITLILYGETRDERPSHIYMDYGKGIYDDKDTADNSDGLPCELIGSNSTNWQFTNYNPNTCILTKVPVKNKFFNDLYYIVTSPFTQFPGIDGQGDYRPHVFSFNGRTFYNFFSNYAVELPN